MLVATGTPLVDRPRDVAHSSCCLAHRTELLVLRSNGHSLAYCEQCDPSAVPAPAIDCLWPV